ncbi:MAG TPA: DHH family phosphoesterase [Anaerolineales bacterium]|nr:DHH family phosphoesterase [Anaerolineales bacterium]
MLNPIYVIGHLNPDTDAIASAVGYAWLLRERDGANAIAARAGALNQQTAWVLKTLAVDAPQLLADASPRFERIARTLPPILPDRPLREAWAVAADSRSAPIVNHEGKPIGLVTGSSVFQFLSRQMDARVDLDSVSVARLLSVAAKDAVDITVPTFPRSMRVRDGRSRVLREERDDFIVTEDDGRYFGICRSPDVLNPPRLQIVLVDHNETNQALGALDEADLLEVLDHHRLGNPYTIRPIPFTVEPVGSTSTLVAERILAAGLTAPRAIAGLLLAGVCSDTLVLRSPTTTDRDRRVAELLAAWAFSGEVSELSYEGVADFGQAVLAAGAALSNRDVDSILSADLKLYEGRDMRFGVAQVEVANLEELNTRLPEISAGLQKTCAARGLGLMILMVTDVVDGGSRLVLAGQTERLNDLPYKRLSDGTLDAPELVSRKKQLLPALLALLE